MSVTDDFREARDRLLALHSDYHQARREFVWPQFSEFNFALDWFDQIAADPEKANNPALVIVEQDGSATAGALRTWPPGPTRWSTGCEARACAAGTA